MVIALVVISVVAIVSVGGTAAYGMWASRRASDETRAQMHSSLVDERTLWLDQQRAWADERRMLLERLTQREGSVLDVLRGPTLVPTTEKVETAPVEWDKDLEPFDFERAAAEGGEGGAG